MDFGSALNSIRQGHPVVRGETTLCYNGAFIIAQDLDGPTYVWEPSQEAILADDWSFVRPEDTYGASVDDPLAQRPSDTEAPGADPEC